MCSFMLLTTYECMGFEATRDTSDMFHAFPFAIPCMQRVVGLEFDVSDMKGVVWKTREMSKLDR